MVERPEKSVDNMRWSKSSQETETPLRWLVLRSAIAIGVSILILVGAVVGATSGSHNSMNAAVILGTGLALLPAGVYGFGVKTRISIALAGIVLLGVTGMAWGIFLIGHHASAFSGVFIIPAFFITLLSSGVYAARDQAQR